MACLQFWLGITVYVDCSALLGHAGEPFTVSLTWRESPAAHAECTDLNPVGFFRTGKSWLPETALASSSAYSHWSVFQSSVRTEFPCVWKRRAKSRVCEMMWALAFACGGASYLLSPTPAYFIIKTGVRLRQYLESNLLSRLNHGGGLK